MTGFTKHLRVATAAASLACLTAVASAALTVNTWTSNLGTNGGNFILTLTDTGSSFNWSLTVDPWNAEALGLFVDFGAVTIPTPVTLTNVNPLGEVSVFATDTTSGDCGNGCNLNGGIGADVPLNGGDWDIVFRLGSNGFDGIQTFSWTTADFGLTESSLGLVGIRSQQNCNTGDILPNGASCDGSEKAYSTTGGGTTGGGTTGGGSTGGGNIPEPGSIGLVGLGLGLLAAGFMSRRRRQAQSEAV